MNEHTSLSELLATYQQAHLRGMWRESAERAEARGDNHSAEFARSEMTELPGPLEALAANVELVKRLIGSRWSTVRDAREAGHSWSDIAEVIGCDEPTLIDTYTAAIERQERYVGGLHDAPRARAVLLDL